MLGTFCITGHIWRNFVSLVIFGEILYHWSYLGEHFISLVIFGRAFCISGHIWANILYHWSYSGEHFYNWSSPNILCHWPYLGEHFVSLVIFGRPFFIKGNNVKRFIFVVWYTVHYVRWLFGQGTLSIMGQNEEGHFVRIEQRGRREWHGPYAHLSLTIHQYNYTRYKIASHLYSNDSLILMVPGFFWH